MSINQIFYKIFLRDNCFETHCSLTIERLDAFLTVKNATAIAAKYNIKPAIKICKTY